MENTNKITYTVRPNPLANEEKGISPFFAKVIRSNQAIDLQGLVKEMAGKNTTVSRQDILVVMDLFYETVTAKLQQGFNVNTGIFNAYVSVKGGFESKDENFNSNKHYLNVNVKPINSFIKDVSKDAEMRRVDIDPIEAKLSSYYDLASKQTNSAITPNFVATINGSNFKMDLNRDDHGIWFVNQESNEQVKVVDVHQNSISQIMFTVPELGAGNYSIMLKSGMASTPTTKILNQTLRVTSQTLAA